MTRLRRMPLRIGPEHLVRQLFLLLGHRVVEIVEGRDQLLQMLDVCFGDLLVGLHVLHRVHCRVLLSALHESLIHIAGVFTHDLGELIPLRLLGRAGHSSQRRSCASAEARINVLDQGSLLTRRWSKPDSNSSIKIPKYQYVGV
jgi:hypothetical protein